LNRLSQSSILQAEGALAQKLFNIIRIGISAIHSNEPVLLGQAMDQYADALQSVQLEIPATYADRTTLRALPGVLGVKGAGALQADAILVLVKNDEQSRKNIISTATSRGLVLVTDGLSREPGLVCLSKD
jgi:phosphomevalonate kinase